MIWLFVFMAALLLLIDAILLIPAVQNKIADIAVRQIDKKVENKISLDKLRVTLPNIVVVKDLFVEDKNPGDTLVKLKKLKVNIDILQLLQRELSIGSIELADVKGRIWRASNDSVLNIQYFVNQLTTSGKKKIGSKQKSEFNFSFGKIDLQNIRFQYLDSMNRLYLTTFAGNLNTSISKLDIQKLAFGIQQLELRNSQTLLEMASVDSEKTRENKEGSRNVTIELGKRLVLEDVSYTMKDTLSGMDMEVIAGDLQLETVRFNLMEQLVEYGSISLNNSFFSNIGQKAAHSAEEVQEAVAKTQNNWRITGGSIEMEDNQVIISNAQTTNVTNYFDPNDLRIHLTEASLDDIIYSPAEMSGTVNKLAASEGESFNITRFHTDFIFTENNLSITNFLLETSNSALLPEVNASYPSKKALFNLSDGVELEASIEPSLIHLDDIAYFLGRSGERLKDSLPFDKFQLSMQSQGKFPVVSIEELVLKAGKNTVIDVHGEIAGIPDFSTATIDLRIDTLHTIDADYKQLLAVSTNENGIRFPKNIGVGGKIEGNLSNLTATLTMNTEKSSVILITGDYAQDTLNNRRSVNGKIDIPRLNLGYFLNDTTYQQLKMDAEFDVLLENNKPVDAWVNINIPTVGYRNYNYKDIALTSTYQNDSIQANFSVNDEFATISGSIGANLADTIPSLSGQMDLVKFYPQQVNIGQNNYFASGRLKTNLQGSHPGNLNGRLNVYDVFIQKDERTFKVDSFVVNATNKENISRYSISSRLVTMNYEGSVNVTGLPAVIPAHVNRYFNLPQYEETVIENENEYFDLEAEIYNTDIFTEVLVPGLKNFKPCRLEVHYNRADKRLDADVNFPLISFGKMQVDSLRILVNSDNARLNYHTKFEKAATGKFWLEDFNIQGNIQDNRISNEFRIVENDSLKYLVKSTLKSEQGQMTGHLVTDSLILDFQTWNVPEDNEVVISDKKFHFTNFSISRDGQRASVESHMDDGLKKTTLSFNDFNARSITNVISADKTIINGLLFGESTVWFDPGFAFTSDLKVQELAFLEESIGDLNLMANNKELQQFRVNVSVSGRNELSVEGSYESSGTGQVNLDTELTRIDLGTVEPFLSPNVTRLSGTMRGKLSVSGTMNDPELTGNINLVDVEVIPTYLNTLVSISDGALSIADEQITINTFRLQDANENTATLSGTVGFSDMTNPRLDMTFSSTNFLLLNTEQTTDRASYYGKVIANLDVQANGFALSPQLDVSVEVLEGTDLTYVVKSQAPASIEKSGLVEFADRDTLKVQVDEYQSLIDTTTPAALRGIGLQANIELNPEATIHVQLDPISEEQMNLNGSANLSLKKNINGELSMVGRYEIEQGTYELKLYEFLRREFQIKEGSYIAWSGNIGNPRADLTAVYVVETSPSELLPARRGNNQNNMLRTKRPFYVNLMISGELLSPELSFNLEAPPGLQGTEVAAVVQNINQDESRLNQQVFSLLLFKRFMSEEMLAGGNFNQQLTTSAREGLNNLISDQLTRFAETYIKGFDINLDIDSYGQLEETDNSILSNTQVQLQVSKTLFDERLIVSVGSNVTLEESPEQQQLPGNQTGIIGDISVEYKLTPEGNWRLKGFNKTEFEDVIDGEVTKTGVSILYSTNFYRFSDLFGNKQNKKSGEKENPQ